MKTIVVRIGRDGVIKAETRGLKGEACLPYITSLEQMLDAETVDSHFTDEYYEREGVEVTDAEALQQRLGPQ